MIFTRALVVLALLPLVTAGCRKQQSAPSAAPTASPAAPTAAPSKLPDQPPLPEIHCPPAETFAALGGKGRALHTDCVVFAPGRYWLATALSHDLKTGKNARLHFLSGSPASRVMVFDVQPLPAAEIESLVKESGKGGKVGVRIRRTRDDKALVRLGITSQRGDDSKPELREIGLLLQLVAHAPPKLLWIGPGDQVSTGADGCITEQVVDFELLFRTRLERFVMTGSRPAPGAKAASCGSGPSMQDTVAVKAVSLPRGRVLGEDAGPPTRNP